ncbi:MAG TPA: response regulator transcription factor [Caldithrix abyssi]|uniref:Response regulator transcription factor n=1 Tax=Caldithrix abyssi TaxID=187145 RepID=A0A7V4TZN0_CALAY|nr:response regulator transcription factor [Caldithrix abyssi]
MKKIKTLIVDDAAIIRQELKILFADYPEIEIIGEASCLDEAIQIIHEQSPDVVFLDIQLRNENGFDLLEKIDVHFKIIFITAYDQYAIRAFEVNALDYLLKPIKKERLGKALQKLHPENTRISEPHRVLDYDDVLYLMINSSFKFIKVKLLKCIIAAGKYSYIFYADRKNKDLVSKTLLEWETILPPKYFIRIHRSTIINFEFVESVKKLKNYTYEVYLKGREEPFTISRRYAAKLKKMLNA